MRESEGEEKDEEEEEEKEEGGSLSQFHKPL